MLRWPEREKEGKRSRGHERVGQHVYLNTWDNEGVVSMLLGMELFLLVKHTNSLLRMKMEIHTQQQTCPWAKTDAQVVTKTHIHSWINTCVVSSDITEQSLQI